jgi:hypothetical protein
LHRKIFQPQLKLLEYIRHRQTLASLFLKVSGFKDFSQIGFCGIKLKSAQSQNKSFTFRGEVEEVWLRKKGHLYGLPVTFQSAAAAENAKWHVHFSMKSAYGLKPPALGFSCSLLE